MPLARKRAHVKELLFRRTPGLKVDAAIAETGREGISRCRDAADASIARLQSRASRGLSMLISARGDSKVFRHLCRNDARCALMPRWPPFFPPISVAIARPPRRATRAGLLHYRDALAMYID